MLFFNILPLVLKLASAISEFCSPLYVVFLATWSDHHSVVSAQDNRE